MMANLMVDSRERDILLALRAAGPLSRWELHEKTGQTPNRVGSVVEGMVRRQLVRERAPESQRAGRPRVPLEIDPVGRHFIGVAINPGGVAACRLGLTGDVLERLKSPAHVDPIKLIGAAANIVRAAVDPRTIGVGVTVTGFIDPVGRSLLLSSSVPGQKPVSLRALDRAAGSTPMVLGNDMHALAARWSITGPAGTAENVLLVWFDDGRMGSAFLAGGRPCGGVLAGANELGHVRFFVETEPCFCGQTGCLERIVSTRFLQSRGRSRQTLAERIDQSSASDAPLRDMVRHLCAGLSNAVNFLRPHRLVLVSPLAGQLAFRDLVVGGTRDLLLAPLRAAVTIDFWDQPAHESPENAAWLAHAELLWTGWNQAGPTPVGKGGA